MLRGHLGGARGATRTRGRRAGANSAHVLSVADARCAQVSIAATALVAQGVRSARARCRNFPARTARALAARWSVRSGALEHEYLGHTAAVFSIALEEESGCLVSCAADACVRVRRA